MLKMVSKDHRRWHDMMTLMTTVVLKRNCLFNFCGCYCGRLGRSFSIFVASAVLGV